MRIIKNKAGFTLVELLVTVGIIGILAAIAIPQFAAYRAKAFCSAVKSDLGNYAVAAEAYFTDYEVYTTAIVGGGMTTFKPTPGVTLIHDSAMSSPGIDGFTVVAYHPNCDLNNNGVMDSYTWDSTAGGGQF